MNGQDYLAVDRKCTEECKELTSTQFGVKLYVAHVMTLHRGKQDATDAIAAELQVHWQENWLCRRKP